MGYIFITLVIIGLPFFYLFKLRRLRTPGGIVLFLYMGSIFSAVFTDHFIDYYTIEASIFLGFTLLLFLTPLIFHAIRFKDSIIIGNYKLLLPFARLLVFFGLISIINLCFKLENIFDNILAPTAYRSERISGSISFSSGILEYTALIGNNYYYLQLLMFFIISIIYPQKRLLQLLLFFSSLANPFTALAVDMSRGGLIIWLIMAVLIYMSLYQYIGEAVRSRINGWLNIFFVIILALFMIVSFGRGVAGGDLSVYFIDYFAHQFGNFNKFYSVAYDQNNNISFIFNVLGYERISITDNANQLMDKYGFSINVFATFIGDLIIGFDRVVVFLMAITFALIYGLLIRSNSAGFGTLILVFAFCDIFVWGLFYYNHGWSISNLLFVVVIGLRYLFNPNFGGIIILKPCLNFKRH